MSYTRTTWVNTETALSAANLNNIEDGIEEALDKASEAQTDVATLSDTVSGLGTTVTNLGNTVAGHTTSIGTLNSSVNSLASDVTTLKNRDADYITAQGTQENGWTYRKWNSGIAEAWYSYSTGTSIHVEYADSINGGFDTGTSSSRYTVAPPDFPNGLFNETPIVDCSIRGRDMSLMAVPTVTASSTSAGEWYGHKSTKNTQDRAKVFQFHCIGTWK